MYAGDFIAYIVEGVSISLDPEHLQWAELPSVRFLAGNKIQLIWFKEDNVMKVLKLRESPPIIWRPSGVGVEKKTQVEEVAGGKEGRAGGQVLSMGFQH